MWKKRESGWTLLAAALAVTGLMLATLPDSRHGKDSTTEGQVVNPKEFRLDPDVPQPPARTPDGMTANVVPVRMVTRDAVYQRGAQARSDLRTEGPPRPGARHAGSPTWPPTAATPSALPAVQQAPAPPTPATPPTPPMRTSFETIDFDTNATNTSGGLFIPPDPHGAAGPSHVVAVANVTLRIHQKNGTIDVDTSLKNFFAALSPPTNTFDPKVLYDQYAGRWVVVTMEFVDATSSSIYVAVSDDSNPNGTWHMTKINSLINIGGTNRWADYPGFAVDEEAVYITANMFAFPSAGSAFGGTRLWVIDKGIAGGFYAGSAASVSVYDPWTSTGFPATTHMAAHTYGTVPTNVGTFLVAFSGLSGGGNEFVQVIRIDTPLGTPTFNAQHINVGDIDAVAAELPGAPQLGTGTTVLTNDRRTLDAVWRNGSLYVVATVLRNSGINNGQPTAFWWQFDTSNLAALSLTDSGEIGGEELAGGAYTFFPSIAVNSANHVAIGFSVAAPSIYVSSAFALRSPQDPKGTFRTPAFLRRGTDYYVRTFSGSNNRWGDYTGTALDPSDDCFWVYNEHAMTRGTITNGTQDGRWDTAFGHVCSTDFEAFIADAEPGGGSGETARATDEVESGT